MRMAQEVRSTMRGGSPEFEAVNEGNPYAAHARGCQAMARQCNRREEQELWLRIARDWLRVARGEVEPPPRTTR
jgi:hypothetical protein